MPRSLKRGFLFGPKPTVLSQAPKNDGRVIEVVPMPIPYDTAATSHFYSDQAI